MSPGAIIRRRGSGLGHIQSHVESSYRIGLRVEEAERRHPHNHSTDRNMESKLHEDSPNSQYYRVRHTPSPGATSMANVIVLKKEGSQSPAGSGDRPRLMIVSSNTNNFKQLVHRGADSSSLVRGTEQERRMEDHRESIDRGHLKQLPRSQHMKYDKSKH